MPELNIENLWSDITFSEIQGDNEMQIKIFTTGGGSISNYISEDEAKQIVQHFKEQFKWE